MTFIESIKSVLISNYANFSGRALRSEYWWFTLFNVVCQMALLFVSAMIASGFFMIVYLVFTLATLIPSLAVSARRFHDTDRSGWWILLSLVPLGFIVLIVFLAQRGTEGPNKFGPEYSAAGTALKAHESM